LEVLVRKQRNYLTIGGFAVNIYGYGRNTGDIDILLKIRLLTNLRIAIKQMGLGGILKY
jgi:hypothetical protein